MPTTKYSPDSPLWGGTHPRSRHSHTVAAPDRPRAHHSPQEPFSGQNLLRPFPLTPSPSQPLLRPRPQNAATVCFTVPRPGPARGSAALDICWPPAYFGWFQRQAAAHRGRPQPKNKSVSRPLADSPGQAERPAESRSGSSTSMENRLGSVFSAVSASSA